MENNNEGEINWEKTGNTGIKIREATGEKFSEKLEREPFFENRIECEWLTTEEAASYLSITPNALRIKVHRFQIPAYRFGNRRLRFRREDCRTLFVRKGAI
jgi:excisionase family DNA binding protein